MTLDTFIQMATNGRASSFVKPEVLEAFLPLLWARGYWVTRIESAEIVGGRTIVNFHYGVIGLDGPENWESHQDIGRHTRLVQSKIAEAKTSGLPIEFQVWIEKDDSVTGELP